MSYEVCQSSANPRLLILLTDELEESVRVVNKIIDLLINLHFDGNAPKNRCFISVLGYSGNAQKLCSGWLSELDSSPLRTEITEKEVPDGVGGKINVKVMQPIWVEPSNKHLSNELYSNSIRLATQCCETWSNKFLMSPIIIDCSEECHVDYAMDEIDKMKRIQTLDGPVLFWGCYSNQNRVKDIPFSKIPQKWNEQLYKYNLNEKDYINGCLSREALFAILTSLMEMGGDKGIEL